MKFHYSVGPNPRIVRMFMEERGIELPTVEVDIIGGENLQEDYRRLNPSAQTPCLELDNGKVIAEVTVICDYLDQVTDGDSLLGDTPEDRAETLMWCRRLDARILEPMTLAFRSAEGLPIFENRYHVIPHAADDLKATVQENYHWLDALLAGNDYLCGDRFTLADIQLFVFAEFGSMFGQPLPDDAGNLRAWFARVAGRPSVDASRHPSERG